MRRFGIGVLLLPLAALVFGLTPDVCAAIGDAALPTFADGKQSTLVLVAPGAVKRLRLQTEVICTSIASDVLDVGVEIYDETGALLNDVSAGVGAVLDVMPGESVTIGTGPTQAFLETSTIPLADFAQGIVRVVASSDQVQCNVFVVDDALTPPVALGTLEPGVRLSSGGEAFGRPLPQFSDGQRATHSAFVPGAAKRGRVETNFFCSSFAAGAIDIGVEVFGPDGIGRNDVMAGNGAVLDVQPGTTVTLGTTGTAAYLETTVIVLEGVAQGMARIVSTSGDVLCSAQLLDSDLTPPTSLTALQVHVLGESPPSPTATATDTATPQPTATPTMTLTPTPRPTPKPILGCTGDCNDDLTISVDELVRGINIALGHSSLASCRGFDRDEDGSVDIEELVRAVTGAIAGCVGDRQG